MRQGKGRGNGRGCAVRCGRAKEKMELPTYPQELEYPCFVSDLGEFFKFTPRGELEQFSLALLGCGHAGG